MSQVDKFTFEGYLRQSGRKGIRNKLLVIYTVECASYVAKEIVRQSEHSEVEVIGFSGCTDNEYAIRLLIAMIKHPNVGAVLSVGLGCEYVQASWLSDVATKEGKPSSHLLIQENNGTKTTILRGLELVKEMLLSLEQTPRITMTFQDLIVGAECGGSDFTSGLAGNVAVGHFFDTLVSLGGTAIFEEIVEAVGLKHLLVERALNESVESDLVHTYDKAMAYCKEVGQYSVSPGNFAGGLSTIEEKSMGAFIKSGTSPICGVLKVSQMPENHGLYLLDSTPDPYFMGFGITNPNDNEGIIDLISSGAHLVFLVTGRGNVVGSVIAPVIKITGNTHTYEKMIEDMDFNAGYYLDGTCSKEEMNENLCTLVTRICNGVKTKAEELGHKEYFVPYKYQEKQVVKSCSSK